MADIKTLIDKAAEVQKNAHCPYSKFPVGAALLGTNGKIYTGCNVENCSYPVGICAERTAFVKAVSEGCKTFESIAIITNLKSVPSPCGMCRQTMAEFGVNAVHCARADKTYKTYTWQELLPDAFTPRDLLG